MQEVRHEQEVMRRRQQVGRECGIGRRGTLGNLARDDPERIARHCRLRLVRRGLCVGDEDRRQRIARLHGGFAQPGGRFRSTRAVAQRFAVSDRTASRLLGEREPEGRLQRRTTAGSRVPGRRVTLRSVRRVFHPRAKRNGSFGARLLEWLESAFAARGIA